MSEAHRLLADVAVAAGFGAATIALLTDATLPNVRDDDLDETEALALVDAVEVTAEAGMSDADLVRLVPALQRRYGSDWRRPFWQGQLHAAAIRTADPDRYGRSPVRAVLERAARPATAPATSPDAARETKLHRSEVSTVPNPTSAGSEVAERLAAQITVPVELPLRCDGSRVDCLSASSLAMFLKCPEEWRRHHLRRERFPATPPMAIGSIVDAVVGQLVAEVIAGEPPRAGSELKELFDAARDRFLERNEVAWTAEEPRLMSEHLARAAVSLYADRILPTITSPIAVQRRFRFKLAPEAAWSVIGAIDVEEERRVRDTKVKTKSLYGHAVEGDVQASTYLLARHLEENPAEVFVWDIVLKSGKQRRTTSWTQVPARRSAGQMRSTLLRYAAAARRMVALNAAFGPDEPWDFADPRHTLCSERYCGFFPSCPGGGGLADIVEQPSVDVVPADPTPVASPQPLKAADDEQVLPAPPDPRGVLRDEIPA